jgi:cysteinyl-tRNA synthetase
VMALALLGEGFSLHGGGVDLKFPHHENERAQAVVLGREFARHGTHNGMVMQEGEKMSKSLGNVIDLTSLVQQHDPRAYRLLVLQAHYRAPVEVTSVALEAAERTLKGIDALARRLAEVGAGPQAPGAGDEVLPGFRKYMDDDLGTPQAMAVLFDSVTSANVAFDRGDAAGGVALGRAALAGFEAVGLRAGVASEVGADVLELARRRDEARTAHDWGAADRLREEIVTLGYRVEDTPAGTRVYR